MIYFPLTTDKLQVVTTSTASTDVNCNFVDAAASTLAPSGAGKQNTAITTAATTDVLASPASSTTRTLKQMTIRNKDVSLSQTVTVLFNANGTTYELHKQVLAAGDSLIYIEGIGFFWNKSSSSVITGNANTADVVATSVDTYMSGASLNITNLLQAGAFFRWQFSATKTLAGTAAPTFNVRVGTAGSTADTSRLLFTGSAQTAVVDTGMFFLEVLVRTYSSSGILQGCLEIDHVLSTTGFGTSQCQIIPVTSSAFDLTVAGSIIGVSINPGASAVWTFKTSSVAAYNLTTR